MSQSKRVWAEAGLANVRARQNDVMKASREAARDGLFVAAAEILRMHVEQVIDAENRLFQIICEEDPKHPLDREIEDLLNGGTT